jgi:hypothetical protein
MRAAAHEFRMRKPDDKGFATRVSYESRATRAALVHGDGSQQHEAALALLDGPAIPDSLGYVWQWFNDLDRVRAYTMSGPEPLNHTEIDAWARLTGRTPDALEVDALLMLDRVARSPEAWKEPADG